MQTTTLEPVNLKPEESLSAAGMLAGRLLVGGVFVMAGAQKITAYAGTQSYMDAMGVAAGVLPLVIALEVGLGLALILGWRVRLSALALAGFTALATALFHSDLGDPVQAIMFMKNIMVIGGLLTVASVGGGAWSLDTRRRQ